MAIVRKTLLLCVCLAVFLSGTANATMQCCMSDMDHSATALQMDNGDMPCHEKAQKDSQDSTECNSCDCMHCVKMSSIPPHISTRDEVNSNMQCVTTQSIYSRQPDGIFQPPKFFS